MSEYTFSPQLHTWPFYEEEQERNLRESLNEELWQWLEEQERRDADGKGTKTQTEIGQGKGF
jgi:hypothetical protein